MKRKPGDPVPPRLFVIPAAEADVALVIRRGPSEWRHFVKWDLTTGAFEHGAWLRHNFYPERCDVSPDGRWMVYLGADHKIRYRSPYEMAFSREQWPTSFTAISRVPWVYALAAWVEIGTYSTGCYFCEKPGTEMNEPFVGAQGLPLLPYGIGFNEGGWFQSERRRGWIADPASPVRVSKPCPVNHSVVLVAWMESERHRGCQYKLLHTDGRVTERPEISWADWTREGRLMAATRAGTLLLETLGADGSAATRREFDDLVDLKPDPKPAPDWAQQWT